MSFFHLLELQTLNSLQLNNSICYPFLHVLKNFIDFDCVFSLSLFWECKTRFATEDASKPLLRTPFLGSSKIYRFNLCKCLDHAIRGAHPRWIRSQAPSCSR